MFGLIIKVTNVKFIYVESVIKNMKKIRGIIYDLDGTIILTQKLHEKAWIYAGKKFNIPITK